MRRRIAAFLSVLALLGVFTGAKAAEAFPSHPAAAMLACLGLVCFLAGWQFAYRAGTVDAETPWGRVLAWTASGATALWATFLLLSAFESIAELVLSATPHGAALTRKLPEAAAAASVVIAAIGFKQAVRGPRVAEVSIGVPGLKPGLRGLKIAQISDLHVGPTIRRAQVERVVEKVLALEPDLIAVTGDLVDGDVESLAPHVAPLARLKAPLGVYYVPGNHEYYSGALPWIAKTAELGFTPLINENRVLERDGARLLIAGVPDEQGEYFVPGHAPDQQKAAAGGEGTDFRLLLAHRPDGAAAAARAGFDLQLSGHTHGGQFFPVSLLIPLFHRHSRGLGRSGRMKIYVNPGTGYWGPANRFAVPSEITLLTLVDERPARA